MLDWLTDLLAQGSGAAKGVSGLYNPALGATMVNNPEAIAGAAIQAGVPPPPISESFSEMPGGNKEFEFGSLLDPTPASTTGVAGAPLDLSPPAPVAKGPAAAQSGAVGSLAKSLSGVQAPPAPRTQAIRTPAAPQPSSQIKQGELLALLGSMMGGQERKLAPTLGSVLGG